MFVKREFNRLFWPVLIEQVLATTIGMVNTMMVSGVGVSAISAVSIVDSLNLVIMNLFISFATGATVVVAQQVGAQETHKANETASQAMTACVMTALLSGVAFIIFGNQIINLLFGQAEEQVKASAMIYLVFSGISYPFLATFSMSAGILRASGNTKAPMRASIISNIINVCVGVLCINFLKLGVAGAGIALVSARVVAAGTLALVLFRPEKGVGISTIALKLKKDILWPVMKIGIPTGIDGLIFNGGKVIIQTFVTALGTVALAANSVASSVTGFISIPGNAISIVAVTMVGQAVGSGVFGKDLKKMMRTLVGYSIGLLSVMSIICFPVLPFILDLYAPPEDVKNIAQQIMYLVLILMPLTWPIAFNLPSCIRSTGDTLFLTIASILSMWFVRVLGAWASVNVLNWGLMGIWVFWCADWIVRSVVFIIRASTSPYINRDPCNKTIIHESLT